MKLWMLCADSGIAPDGTKGASVHLRAMTAALQRLGHEVLLVTRRAPDSGSSFPSWRALTDESSLTALAEREGRPEAVIERYSLGHLAALEWARRAHVPFVLEVNAPLVLEAKSHRPLTVGPAVTEAETQLLCGADAVGAVSKPLLDWVSLQRKTNEGTFLLRNGCEPGLFPEPAMSAQDGDPLIVFAGHPKPWHGADRLPAMLKALETMGFLAHVLIIGGGEGADKVLRLAREHGVSSRIQVTGPVGRDEAARLLLMGTLAIAPYPEIEFFYFCPLKIIEAMAAGLPVVSTAQGDIPEIVGRGGLLVPPDDDLALTSAVASLLESPRTRHVLGQRARQKALGSMTWDHAAAALIEGICTARESCQR